MDSSDSIYKGAEMTPEERAYKLFNQISFSDGNDDADIADIAAAIREAVEWAVKDATHQVKAMDCELDEQSSRIAELEVALKEVTDNLEDYINAEYPAYKLAYPHNVAKKDAEMEVVVQARKVLEGKT
jgi:rubrerythrin